MTDLSLDHPAATDPVLAADGYPSEVELQRIRDWSLEAGWRELMDYVQARWAYAEHGYWRQRGDCFELSTAGWSGNEDMIGALQQAYSGVFWAVCFRAQHRGGHYVLDVQRFGSDGKMVREASTPLDERGGVSCKGLAAAAEGHAS